MNRALICSSFADGLELHGSSSCDDVVKMKAAVEKLKNYKNNNFSNSHLFDCGAAGTVLRFLSLRLSRIPGNHVLTGTLRLMQRPQRDLLDLLNHLGVQCTLSTDRMELNSNGWQNLNHAIEVHTGVSSQFASGLVLNAWDLENDLTIKMAGDAVSEGYFQMTIQLVRELGMEIEHQHRDGADQYIVKAHSKIKKAVYNVESDLSSAFAVAAFAVLNGRAVFENFPNPSLQPDFEFIEFLKAMGITADLSDDKLAIETTGSFKGLEADLKNCPDLFPVLAVLCAFATTPSRLYGAPQLIHKESNRIFKTSELLNYIGINHEVKSDGMEIKPSKMNPAAMKAFSYDTDHDHRLAFAAALVESQGLPITILHPEVVSKSFPEFWETVGLTHYI